MYLTFVGRSGAGVLFLLTNDSVQFGNSQIRQGRNQRKLFERKRPFECFFFEGYSRMRSSKSACK